jgi:hypothetical protein
MRRSWNLVTLSLLLLAACGEEEDRAIAPGSSAHGPVRLGFENLAAGRTPSDFRAVTGDWRTRPAPDDGTMVLGQLSEGGSGATYNLILYEKLTAADVEVSTRLRPVSGDEDRGGGVVWRAADERNYYVCRWNPLESNYRVYKVVEGCRIELASADAPDDGRWHEVRAEMRGDAIRCFLDGDLLLEVRDSTLAEPGRIGLWTKADAVTLFDGIRAEPR